MQLKSFRVRKFRNIVDSDDIPVEKLVTCLVGKNEAGKSGLLEALYLLNPAYDTETQVEQQYPRWLMAGDRKSGDLGEAVFITATFTLDADDVAAVAAEYGEAITAGSDLTIAKKYSGHRTWTLPRNEGAIVTHLRSLLPPAIAKLVESSKTLKSLGEAINAIETEDHTEIDSSDINQAKQLVRNKDLLNEDAAFHLVNPILEERIPKFFRFTSYNTLPGRIDLREIIKAGKIAPDSPMHTARALIALAGTDASQLMEEDYELRRTELEAVQIDLTNQVFQFWKQNPDLEVNIDVDKTTEQHGNGTRAVARFLDIRLRDRRTGYSNNFKQRSSGFQWFFSFLAAFSEFENKSETIVLLDEPALSLHGKAQSDFLRFINERLAANSTVIYTTHSPFMVEMGHLERVRIVEDRGPPLGSVVSSDALANDPDSLFPLQAALGYDIAQSLFIGPNNLVVEGTSDFIHLTIISQIASQKKKVALDPRWRILPSGGATNIPTFVSLVGPHLDITVLADSDTQGMQRVTGMIEKKLITDTRLILANQVTGQKNSDLEDLFSVDDYLSLYNDTFKTKLKASDLGPGDRITKRIEAKIGKTFVHGEVAETLLKTHQSRTLSDETIENFSKLNDLINRTMKS
jgi:predicted ATP-dependent endonuclease of OLD family